MPVCSYLVIPRASGIEAAASSLAALPGCEVARAADRDLLVLVTETDGPEAEQALGARIAAVEEIESLLLVFGELGAPADDPDDPTASHGTQP
jgi:nitrate reductase NapAB chaperone NapD